jgi:GNAT superfamily N-acetyltransferase
MTRPPLTLQVLGDTPSNRAQVNAVLQAATDYHLLVEGRAPTAAHVEEFFTDVPPGYDLKAMAPLGFFVGDEMVGVGGVLRGWNTTNKCIIGLLLFAPQWRRGGCGRQALALIESLVRSWRGYDTLRVAVVATNDDALVFWRKVGFVDTGEIKPAYGPYVANIVILEKPLAPGPQPI